MSPIFQSRHRFCISSRCATTAFLALLLAANVSAADAKSEWAQLNENGKLVYKTTAAGDRIKDFSFAGYKGGGVKLPEVAVKKTVQPSGGDDTATIQAALDSVAALEPANGFRGAVLLGAGRFHCEGPLNIKGDGVVLRGSGSGTNGTVIVLNGKPHVGVVMGGAASVKPAGKGTKITDAYVPSGVTSFHVASTAGLAAGDTVLVVRPVTAEWVKFMGMDTLVRNGKKERWVSGDIQAERKIARIKDNEITLDIPLSDSLDAKFLGDKGATLVKAAKSGFISEVGLEYLRMVSPPQAIGIDQPQYQAVRVRGVEDAWIRDLAIVDTIDSVQLGGGTKRVTVEDVEITHTVATVGAAKPADFAADGSQILFYRCTGKGDGLFYFVTGGKVIGPNVLLQCTFHGNGLIEPHQRWATGLLLDNCQVPESGIAYMNRGEMGSGHGWTIGWSVAWNCRSKTILNQNPPGTVNWVIGCVGKRETVARPFSREPKLPEGTYDAHGAPVSPASLYLAQLRERLGEQAVENVQARAAK